MLYSHHKALYYIYVYKMSLYTLKFNIRINMTRLKVQQPCKLLGTDILYPMVLGNKP